MTMSDELASRPVGRWGQLLLIAASLALAVLLCEIALRMTGQKFRPNSYPPHTLSLLQFEVWEPYGYRLVPSTSSTYRYPQAHPRTITVVSNHDGFRASRELDEPDARPRILFLGDSLVFGHGVQESERFTDVLQSRNPSWRIDNMGIPGYGPDLMLRSLEAVGLKLKPLMVVFCMFTNDFRRVRPEYAGTGFPVQRYKLKSGHLVTVPYPTPNLWNRLYLSVAINKVLWDFTSWEWDLNQAILDRFEQIGDQQPFRKAIIFLPGTSDTSSDKKRRFWLRQYAEHHATPFLDLSDAIHKIGGQAFLEGDNHLSPTGHLVVARELDRFLSECHLPSP